MLARRISFVVAVAACWAVSMNVIMLVMMFLIWSGSNGLPSTWTIGDTIDTLKFTSGGTAFVGALFATITLVAERGKRFLDIWPGRIARWGAIAGVLAMTPIEISSRIAHGPVKGWVEALMMIAVAGMGGAGFARETQTLAAWWERRKRARAGVEVDEAPRDAVGLD
ncbi:MAG TPA: hypothetical protein VN706_12055 [Gemmatimonadaceae bacterium]|nr:hypothetical protein [Gemmatimonadaceae bacterium]